MKYFFGGLVLCVQFGKILETAQFFSGSVLGAFSGPIFGAYLRVHFGGLPRGSFGGLIGDLFGAY